MMMMMMIIIIIMIINFLDFPSAEFYPDGKNAENQGIFCRP